MSGRDLRTFLSDHRKSNLNSAKNEEELLHTFLVGASRTRRYQQVDYGKLLASAKQQRVLAEERLKRVERLSNRGKESRETSLLRQHRDMWEREHARLVQWRHKAQMELEHWRSDVVLHGDEELKSFVADVTAYESELYDKRQKFEEDTVEPIWSLRVDLKSWVGSRTVEGDDDDVSHEAVLHELDSVKEQQRRIQGILQSEYDALWSEIKDYSSEYLPDMVNEGEMCRGIPSEALALECPDEDLRESTLREFTRLDECYQAMLDQWEEQNREIISLPHGGWSEVDAERFACVLEQYPASLSNRRLMYIDRLLREMPHKTRTEIVEHESWHSALTHYHTQRGGYLRSWVEHRRGLLQRVTAVFNESQRVFGARQQAREEREQQLKICKELHSKISRWREERLEVMRVEGEVAAHVREEEEARRREEEERERRRRERDRAKLGAYHAEKDYQSQLERRETEKRREAMRAWREEQAKRNKQRVEYRHELQLAREEERKEAAERALQEHREREKRLEVVKQQVQVNVSADPLRVLRDTKAWHSRVAGPHGPPPDLFPLHSFTDDVVTSDQRFRVAAALREAGLHTTTYARKIMATIPPPLPPRPDQQSSLFK